MAPRAEIKVGILGATGKLTISYILAPCHINQLNKPGTVGQRFIQLLSTHPYFRLHALGASSRSAGQSYAAATKWKLATPIPEDVAGMTVLECDPKVREFGECGVVFSGLDEKVGEIGEWFILLLTGAFRVIRRREDEMPRVTKSAYVFAWLSEEPLLS